MKIKSKFNVIDVLVIVFLLALIFGIVFFVLRQSNSIYAGINEKDVSYTVCIRGVDEKHLSSFTEGAQVLDSSNLSGIGEVTSVTLAKATSVSETASPADGEGGFVLTETDIPGIYDVYLTIKAKASADVRGVYYIGNLRMTVGSSVFVRCGDYAAQSFITSFSIS